MIVALAPLAYTFPSGAELPRHLELEERSGPRWIQVNRLPFSPIPPHRDTQRCRFFDVVQPPDGTPSFNVEAILVPQRPMLQLQRISVLTAIPRLSTKASQANKGGEGLRMLA